MREEMRNDEGEAMKLGIFGKAKPVENVHNLHVY